MTSLHLMACALLGSAAVLTTPVRAQSLNEVPQIADLIAVETAKYEAARREHDQVEAAERNAAAQAKKAETTYRAAVLAEQKRLFALQTEFKAAQAAHEDSMDQLVDAKTTREKLRPRRGRKETEESLAARLAASKAQEAADNAEVRARTAEDKLLAQNVADHAKESLAWVTAVERWETAKSQLFIADGKFVKATNAYIAYLNRFPPPFLKKVVVQANGETKYNAFWVQGTAPSPEDGSSLEQLLAADRDLMNDLAELDPILEEQREARLALAKRIRVQDEQVAKFAAEYGYSRQMAVAIPVLIELASVGVDIYTTGGTATLTEKLSEYAIKSGVGTAVGKFGAGQIMPYTGFGESKSDAANNRPLDETTAPGAIASVAFSDTIEKFVSAGVADSLPASRNLSQAARTGLSQFKGKTYLKSFNDGLPKAMVESALKSVAAAYFNDSASQAQKDMMETLFKAQADHAAFEQLRQQDRALIELRRKYALALADVRFRQSLVINAPQLLALTNKLIPERDFKNEVAIRLEFSTGLSSTPEVTIGGQKVENLHRVGDARNVWSGTLAGKQSGSDAKQLPISVRLPGAEKTALKLDANPATLPRLDVKSLKWSKVEQAPDTFHTIKIGAALGDLTGFWEFEDDVDFVGLIYIEHKGDRLSAKIARDAHAFREGDTLFNASINDDNVAGKILIRLAPKYKKCRQDLWVNFTAIVSEDGTSMESVREGRWVDFNNCRVSSDRSAKLRLTRGLDKSGEPIRYRSSQGGPN